MKYLNWFVLAVVLTCSASCERSGAATESSEEPAAEAAATASEAKQAQAPEDEGDKSSIVTKKVVHFPRQVDPACRNGKAKVYDECTDQRIILAEALGKAKATDKALLVVYGAEWCIWCHVFDKYVDGQYARYDYEFEYTDGPYEWEMEEEVSATTKAEAEALNHYVADHFVVAYIEAHYAPHGDAAIAATGVDPTSFNYYPFIMSVGHDGKVAAVMDAYTDVPGLEVRESGGEEYRGFQRKVLTAELRELYAKTMPSSQLSEAP